LYRKIDKKFESLSSNLEMQIYNNFIKPSLNSIEDTLKTNIDDIKNKIGNLNSNNNNIDITSNRSLGESFENEFLKSANTRKGKMDNKLEEINVLGERLYEKLLEKVFICF
jgi:DUF4097 and DUF4098 domain-containing protein YvlB